MKINGKMLLYGVVISLVILLLLMSFGIISTGKNSGNAVNNASNMPEKCKAPDGQDLAAWKEHLGHHAETQDCLKYYQ